MKKTPKEECKERFQKRFKDEMEESFEKWRDTKGGWPSRTECFEEWFLPEINKAVEATKMEIGEEIEKLIQIHKEEACKICRVYNYDEVNMARFVENPLVCSMAYTHIDFVRELKALFLSSLHLSDKE